MLFQSSFGCSDNTIVGLFKSHPIGRRLGIGTDSSFWIGKFGGLRDGVAILTDAQLFANMGKPIDGKRPLVRIPIGQITFVSQIEKDDRKDNRKDDNKDDKKD
ncbi:MAG: hypothetical protein ACOYIB_08975 [Desulfosporosinus sp.]|jgi:hypothetical protein